MFKSYALSSPQINNEPFHFDWEEKRRKGIERKRKQI